MKNTRTMAIQMPEETYQRLKAYLKRHQLKQKDFVTRLVQAEVEKDDIAAPGGGAVSRQKQLLFRSDSGIMITERRWTP